MALAEAARACSWSAASLSLSIIGPTLGRISVTVWSSWVRVLSRRTTLSFTSGEPSRALRCEVIAWTSSPISAIGTCCTLARMSSTLAVRATTSPDEVLGITGNCALSAWRSPGQRRLRRAGRLDEIDHAPADQGRVLRQPGPQAALDQPGAIVLSVAEAGRG